MARSKSSGRWLKAHFDDVYVRRAQQEGYRSRAVYKLLEIQERDKIFRRGMTVVDLGAAPGGWSQIAAKLIAPEGKIVALDILPMESLPGVDFIQCDFRENAAIENVEKLLDQRQVDLVMSDMAPNISGMNAVDQPRAMELAELSLDLAHKMLTRGGTLLVKVFQGEGFDQFVRDTKSAFEKVTTRKPKASRPQSREVYVLGRNYSL